MSSTITEQFPADQSNLRSARRRKRLNPHSLPTLEVTHARPS
jgi:hypothetical protein